MLKNVLIFPYICMKVGKQSRGYNIQDQFLQDFANDCVFRCFSEFDLSSREFPLAVQTGHAWRPPHGQEYLLTSLSHDASAYDSNALMCLFGNRLPPMCSTKPRDDCDSRGRERCFLRWFFGHGVSLGMDCLRLLLNGQRWCQEILQF